MQVEEGDPIYGIRHKSNELQELLAQLSSSDFKHDFGNIKIDTILKEIVSIKNPTSSIIFKENRTIAKLKQDSGNTNIYDYFKNGPILSPGDRIGNALDENKIVNEIFNIKLEETKRTLINYDIKNKLTPKEQKDNNTENPLKYNEVIDTIKNEEFVININNKITRKYKRSVYPTKVRDTYFNLSFSFYKTSGNTNFILVLDNNFFSMSSLRSSLSREIMLHNDPQSLDYNKNIYNFYILQNNENIGDSGMKINAFDDEDADKMEGENEGVQLKIRIFLLKELPNNQSFYPAFNIGGENPNESSSLFTNANIITKSINNTLNADIKYSDGKTLSVEDLGKVGKKNMASLLAINNLLEENSNDEVVTPILLKRAGDWCQALSLFDINRKYDVYDEATGEKEPGQKSIYDLSTTGYELAIVTHDRILLAYSILLGLNVFFSTKLPTPLNPNEEKKKTKGKSGESNSSTWMIYYKNTFNATVINQSIIESVTEEYIDSIKELMVTTTTIIADSITNLKNIKLPEEDDEYTGRETIAHISKPPFISEKNSIGLYIGNLVVVLRKNLSILANIIPVEQILNCGQQISLIKNNPNVVAHFQKLVSLLDKMKSFKYINTHLTELYTPEEILSDKLTIKTYFEIVKKSRTPSVSEINVQAKFNKILKKISTDYTTCSLIIKDLDFFDIMPCIVEIENVKYQTYTEESQIISNTGTYSIELNRYNITLTGMVLIEIRNMLIAKNLRIPLTSKSILSKLEGASVGTTVVGELRGGGIIDNDIYKSLIIKNRVIY